MAVPVIALHPLVTFDHVGDIPLWLSEGNLQSAAQQLDAAYGHGGGWSPFSGFTLGADNTLTYPGDPPLTPIAAMSVREELVLVYPHSLVAIIQPDRSFEVARMD